MTSLLVEFVNWLEAAHFRRGPCGSAFEQSVALRRLDWAERALHFALSSRWQVLLCTGTIQAQAVLAALILARAGVQIEQVYTSNLTDDAFGRLTAVVGAMSKTTLGFEEGSAHASEPLTGLVANGTYVFCWTGPLREACGIGTRP